MWKISDVHIFCFRPEKPFLGKSGQKNQNCQFKLRFGTKTNSNMQNSMVVSVYFICLSENSYPLWANLVQKIAFVILS